MLVWFLWLVFGCSVVISWVYFITLVDVTLDNIISFIFSCLAPILIRNKNDYQIISSYIYFLHCSNTDFNSTPSKFTNLSLSLKNYINDNCKIIKKNLTLKEEPCRLHTHKLRIVLNNHLSYQMQILSNTKVF